jgi:hypothetical protein
MSQSPQECHGLQRHLWDQVVKAHGYPEGYEGKDTDATFNQPHHHSISLFHALQKIVDGDTKYAGTKIEMARDPVYLRDAFKLVSTGYVGVEDEKNPNVRRVEISAMVYPEDTSFISAAKKSDESEEERKSSKMAVKTEARIPVMFMTNINKKELKDLSVTRHYQADKPSRVYAGMTNRVLETLPQDIVNFLYDGTLPAEPKLN